MRILGIETSCDETACAIVQHQGTHFNIVSETVLSQMQTHKKYGGVVPEVAARKHIANIIPVIDQTLKKAHLTLHDMDLMAVTQGPGLISSLIIGVETAKALSLAADIPLIGVNHLEGHVASNLIQNTEISYPALCLIISGGHTQFVLIKKEGEYEIVGKTLDDACGESFDKVAKILGLPYPGGPQVEKLAKEGKAVIDFPRPMCHMDTLDMSFSGLKTAVKYYVKDHLDVLENEQKKKDICASFQTAVVDVLVQKTIKAVEMYDVQTMMLAGGACANQSIRAGIGQAMKEKSRKMLVPELKYCMDNAVMIAVAGYLQFQRKKEKQVLQVNPNLNF